MKVVLDTNVFISGIHWNGGSRKILESWLSGDFDLIVSIPIVEEITRTLRNFKIPLEIKDIELWESLILEKSDVVIPKEKIDIVVDPDDNKFIEAAVEVKAHYIVSQDKHLLVIKEY